LQERGARDGLGALDVSARRSQHHRGAVSGGTQSLLITAASEATDGYTPVRGKAAGAVDVPLSLHDATISARLQHSFGDVQAAARVGTFEEKRNAGLKGAASTAKGSSGTITIAHRPARASAAGGCRPGAAQRPGQHLGRRGGGPGDHHPGQQRVSTPANGYGVNAALQGHLGAATWEFGADQRWAKGTDHEQFRAVNGALTMGRDAAARPRSADLSGERLRRLALAGDRRVRIDRWTESHASATSSYWRPA